MAKIKHLEGLRGMAALVVVNEHLLKLFFVMAFSDSALRQSGLYESLSFPPLNMFHNGAWAVCAFFVLSGYVLSQSFFSKGISGYREPIARIAARYFRLAIPITGSLLLVWIVMSMNGMYFAEAVDLSHSKEINQYESTPSILSLLKQGFVSALFQDHYAYNPPLWTMSVEMIASIGIFILHMVFYTFADSKNAFYIRLFIYAGLCLLLFPTMYVGFVLGMFICDCKNDKRADVFLERYSRLWVPIALSIGVLLCGYMIRGLYTNPYKLITFQEFSPYHEYLYNTWGAFFLIFGISYSKKIKQLMSGSCMQNIGKISFPLYLTHYIVMSSFTAYLYVVTPLDSHLHKALVAIAISLPVMFVVAYIFEKFVNEPAMKISRTVYKAISNALSKTRPGFDHAAQVEAKQ